MVVTHVGGWKQIRICQIHFICFTFQFKSSNYSNRHKLAFMFKHKLKVVIVYYGPQNVLRTMYTKFGVCLCAESMLDTKCTKYK